MPKGRKRILSNEDVSDIVEAFQIDNTLTKREVASKYQISLPTLYKVLPFFLKDYKYFPKYKTSEVCHSGG